MDYQAFINKFYNDNKQSIFAVGENLTAINLSGHDLTNANFSTAKLNGANFAGCTLVNSRFTESNLVDADFSNANLQFARFNEAKLYDATFKNANLAHANLNGALLPTNWFQLTYFTDNDFDPIEILTYDAENERIIAFGLHEPMNIIRKYVNDHQNSKENLGVNAQNYERITVILNFFEQLISMQQR